MKKNVLIIISLAFVSSFLFIGCNKDNTKEEIDNDPGSATDNAQAERIFNNVSNIADQAYNSEKFYKSSDDGDENILGNCATIILDTSVYPRMLTVDFGEENCLCGDGRYRRGKIIVSFTGRYREEGTMLTHTFDNYFVNDNQVKGTRIVTNEGRNEDDNLYFTINVDGQIIKADGSGQITWISNREREWIEGEDTYEWFDDVYLITGEGHGKTAAGRNYIVKITNPLRKEIGCRYFVSGTYEFTPEGIPTRIVDFGDGECDKIITVTVNGVTVIINLP